MIPDTLNSGPGPDRIQSATGTADTIDCGADDGVIDTVIANGSDLLINRANDTVIRG